MQTKRYAAEGALAFVAALMTPALAHAAGKAVINERTLTMGVLALAAIAAFAVWLNVMAKER